MQLNPTAMLTAPDYFDYLQNRVVIRFKRVDKPDAAVVKLSLSKRDTYEHVVAALAAEIKADPTKVKVGQGPGFDSKRSLGTMLAYGSNYTYGFGYSSYSFTTGSD